MDGLPALAQQWLRDLDDEIATAVMSLERLLRITQSASPASPDLRLQVANFDGVLRACGVLAPFRLPPAVAEALSAAPEPLLARVRAAAQKLEDTKRAIKQIMLVLRQVLHCAELTVCMPACVLFSCSKADCIRSPCAHRTRSISSGWKTCAARFSRRACSRPARRSSRAVLPLQPRLRPLALALLDLTLSGRQFRRRLRLLLLLLAVLRKSLRRLLPACLLKACPGCNSCL